EMKSRIKDLKQGSPKEKLRAAALLVTLKGPEAVNEWAIDRSLLLKVLSSDDIWAAPWVLTELRQGNLDPDVLRLIGALKPPEALPVLMALFNKTIEAYRLPSPRLSHEKPEKIPLYPAKQKKLKEKKTPDPVLIVRTMGHFKDEPQVKEALRNFLKQILAEKGEVSGRESLTAEIIKSLGRVEDHESKEAIFEIWSRKWPRSSEAHLIRRSALEAMASLGDKAVWERILKTAQNKTLNFVENQIMLREVADFFGEIRYNDAVPFLINVINHPSASDLMLKACFQALSRMASPEAEDCLKDFVQGPSWYLSQNAASALESLTLEKAFWNNLKGIQ
ncbi:MAG: hypothetical protein JRI34_13000, partial [Deltaproteobacteria bacterium]|nr:hypothetical protein [Deltaproteobacteria bacterium]